jgi:hypothetical protein
MKGSIAVIGAGWYGCHIASSLSALGFETKVFEQHDRPLHEASGNNQFRLHLGFHYPRHHATRLQSRDGFMRFMERYGELSREVPENIYAVPKEDSLLDFSTYRLVMTSTGLPFREVKDVSIPLRKIEGLMLTEERILLTEKAREYFVGRLGSSLRLGERAESIEESESAISVNGESFDLLVDATWGQHIGLPMKFFFEPTLLLYYETDSRFPAVTLVDGPLCSIYPTEDPTIYTLSSVPFTPLAHCGTSQEARAIRDSVTTEQIAERRRSMEAQIAEYVPDFHDHFRYIGPQLSIKSKPIGSFDDRSCYVFRRGRKFFVMSGKIDTIFFATERILSLIESGIVVTSSSATSQLRREITARVT